LILKRSGVFRSVLSIAAGGRENPPAALAVVAFGENDRLLIRYSTEQCGNKKNLSIDMLVLLVLFDLWWYNNKSL